jgi:hypothetical protein
MDEEYRAFCLRDAEWYQKKAEEAREACEKDPEGYYKESLRCAQLLCHVLPVIVKKSLESDEFKAAETIYKVSTTWERFSDKVRGWFSDNFPKLRDIGHRAAVALLYGFKSTIDISFEFVENSQVLLLLFWCWFCNQFPQDVRARV